MIPEIGIVVGLYILTRLTSPQRRTLHVALTVVTAVVTVITVVDLAIQGFGGTSLMTRLTQKRPTTTAQPDLAPAAKPTVIVSSVTRTGGGSIQTPLGFGIVLNKASSLEREWIVVHDPRVPADLTGTPGVSIAWKRQEYSGEYRYRAPLTLQTTAAIRAYELRFLVFDIWGTHVRSLSYTSLEDLAAGSSKQIEGEWRVFSENEAEEHYASIGYVARVRLSEGRVVEADRGPVLEEARKFSSKFAAEDLEPKPVAQPAPGK